MVVGNTGSGKSTFVNFVVGKHLIPDDKTVLGSTTYSCEDYVMKIGSDPLQSETSNFEFFYDRTSDLTYCDCPGFKDSRGALKDIENAYALKKISSDSTSIKGVVVVISYHSLMSDRGKSLRDVSTSLRGIIGDRMDVHVFDSLLILVTRVPRDVTLHNLREYMADSGQLPFGAEVLLKVHIYDIEDDREDGLSRFAITQVMRSFKTFPSSYLSMHLSSSAQVALMSALNTEIARNTLSVYLNDWEISGIGRTIKNMHKLDVMKLHLVDNLLSKYLQDLTSQVHTMSRSNANLNGLKKIQTQIPELFNIAGRSIDIIAERLRAEARIKEREEQAQQERERQRVHAEQLRLETERAEQERARLQRERERVQAERDAEERRIRASRHQGRVVQCAQLGFHPLFGYVHVQQNVWSCCGSTDMNSSTCAQARQQEYITFAL